MADDTKMPSAEREVSSAGTSVPASSVFYPLTRLRDDMDRLFDDFFGGRQWPPGRGSEGWGRLPSHFNVVGNGLVEVKLDVSETPEAIEIEAEIPGVSESDLDIALSGGVLTIKGEKTQKSEEKKKDFYRSERSYGSFQRSFGVPDSIDSDRIEATFDKGVLHIVLPKKPEAKTETKKIAVKGS